MSSSHLFNLHREYIKWNAGLDESQAGIKTARRNISNLRYADDITLMAESEKQLKSFFKKVKEESEKAGLKFNLKKKKSNIRASGPKLHGKQKGGKVVIVTDFIFSGSKITVDSDCSHEIRSLPSWKKSYKKI